MKKNMYKKQLLTWSLLLVITVSVTAQHLSESQQKYLDAHAINIKSDSSYGNGQWTELLKHVAEKRIVLLGEFNHGSREVFLTRNDLIKQLHENLGFDVLLFESGLGEVGQIDIDKHTLSPNLMTVGLFGPWRTQAFSELMQYARDNDMDISGFDVQRTNQSFDKLLAQLAHSYRIDSLVYQGLEDRYTQLDRKLKNSQTPIDSVQKSATALTQDYQHLSEVLNGKSQKADKTLLLVSRTIANRIGYLEYRSQFLRDGDLHQRWQSRDEWMSSNAEWLIDNFYPDKKIIVLGHNFHIARHNENEGVMGEYFAKRFGKEMYVLGAFAGAGSYARNGVTPMEEPSTEGLDIKHIIKALDHKVCFLPLVDVSDAPAFDKIIVNDSFIDLKGTNRIVLDKHFDGVLLLDRVSPAVPIIWN